MKRSEALKTIDDECNKFIDDLIKTDPDNLQAFIPLNERILTALEKQGMLPPFAHLKKLGTLDTAWEPEDE